eukprot:2881219-Pyramimonas_sp.AAC.1
MCLFVAFPVSSHGQGFYMGWCGYLLVNRLARRAESRPNTSRAATRLQEQKKQAKRASGQPLRKRARTDTPKPGGVGNPSGDQQV